MTHSFTQEKRIHDLKSVAEYLLDRCRDECITAGDNPNSDIQLIRCKAIIESDEPTDLSEIEELFGGDL